MVLAINSDESSPRSSAAFAALAQQLNGTSNAATSSSSSPTPSVTQNSGAIRSTSIGAAVLMTLACGLLAVF